MVEALHCYLDPERPIGSDMPDCFQIEKGAFSLLTCSCGFCRGLSKVDWERDVQLSDVPLRTPKALRTYVLRFWGPEKPYNVALFGAILSLRERDAQLRCNKTNSDLFSAISILNPVREERSMHQEPPTTL